MSEYSSVQRLESEALRLSAQERVQLAQRLFASIEDEEVGGAAADVERAWLEEAERRYQRYVSGASQTVAWGDALSRVREALRKQ